MSLTNTYFICIKKLYRYIDDGGIGVQGTIEILSHYPIKGLSGQALPQVVLSKGNGFPLDRAFGFARPNSGFEPANPVPIPKTKFVVLARDAGLAKLQTNYDGDKNELRISHSGSSTLFDLSALEGRKAAANHLSDHLDLPTEQHPTLYSAAPHRFTDISVVSPQLMNAVSLINRDSVVSFAEQIGQPVDEKRFRGNIVFSGLPAFSELDWVDQNLQIGEAQLKVVMRTKRCAATEVNLQTGERDLKIPKLLRQNYGHFDMGIYAEVVKGGVVRSGDVLQLLA
jgi:uncharacterized protein YcbX